MTILYYHLHHKRVNVGVANEHQMTNLRLAVMAVYIKTQSGPIIGTFNNVAADAKLDQSILSCIQMRAANNFITNVPKCFGGLQMIETNSNHRIPIKFTAGLPYIEMRPITKAYNKYYLFYRAAALLLIYIKNERGQATLDKTDNLPTLVAFTTLWSLPASPNLLAGSL